MFLRLQPLFDIVLTMKQRIDFLYLKTGSGHISGANALIARLKEKYPNNAEYIPQNGFKDTNLISRIFLKMDIRQPLEILLKTTQITNIQIFGFVSCMSGLINVSDCVIIKSCPATVMKPLSAKDSRRKCQNAEKNVAKTPKKMLPKRRKKMLPKRRKK